jgi:quercetin dioxygenase-like cupin family protein
MPSRPQVRVLDSGPACPMLPMIDGQGSARAVVWPGVGAEARSMIRISLAPGARTVELRHPMEAVYYVLSGAGQALDPASGEVQALVEGSMVHVEPGTAYRIVGGAGGMELVGGPCPADPALFKPLASKGN